MYPVVLKLGPITLYSFGLMMAIAFITANYFFTSELKRRGMNEHLATTITMIALVGGVAGSKLFSLLENWSDFVAHPLEQIFSPAGLTFYGGFLVAGFWIYFVLRRKGISYKIFADMIVPTVFLAYGIGRIGCQLAGDGDYGVPSKLPWAMTYPQGTAKPSQTLGEYFERNPSEEAVWHFDSLSRIPVGKDVLGQTITRFDETTTVHPAPVYETLMCVAGFIFLWSRRRKYELQAGKLFYTALLLMGIERLAIEFIRLNPLYMGLSQAQWISVLFIAVSMYMLAFVYPRRKSDAIENVPALAQK